MTIRAGWTFSGKHFAETVGINGRTTYHIDGKLTPKAVWFAAYRAAKTEHQEARLNALMSAPYALTKPERCELATLLKARKP